MRGNRNWAQFPDTHALRTTRRVRDLACDGMRIFLEIEVRRVSCRCCEAVKRERLDFLAENPRCTKRFAFYVGKRCRSASIKDISDELVLDWHTVKELEKQYMREQLRCARGVIELVDTFS